jgi:hypothetical protein
MNFMLLEANPVRRSGIFLAEPEPFRDAATTPTSTAPKSLDCLLSVQREMILLNNIKYRQVLYVILIMYCV